jgi:hypothetical protein
MIAGVASIATKQTCFWKFGKEMRSRVSTQPSGNGYSLPHGSMHWLNCGDRGD